MPGPLGGLFATGGIAEQLLLWGVLNQFLNQLLQPILLEVMDNVWPKITSQRLSPAECADMVIRGIMTRAEAEAEAAASGLSGDRFDKLALAAGEPIGLEQALEAWRRGFMPEGPTAPDVPSLATAVLQSRLRPEWLEVVKQLGYAPNSIEEAVNAYVKSAIALTEAEAIAKANGFDAHAFDVARWARQNPPGPADLIEMVRRGIIPATGTGPNAVTLEQGIHESAVSNKWVEVYQHLLEYIPPPRTVTALLRAGSITEAQALQLFHDAGLTGELAAAYVADASHQKLTTDKLLAKDTVLQLYDANVIDQPTATQLLTDLKYNAQEITFLLELHDAQQVLKAVNSAVSKIGSLYIARKIDSAVAGTALDSLKIPATQRDTLLFTWGLERDASVRVLSEATIASAWKYGIMSDGEAITELQGLGYTAFDAWVYLSVHNKGPLTSTPAPSPTPTGIGA